MEKRQAGGRQEAGRRRERRKKRKKERVRGGIKEITEDNCRIKCSPFKYNQLKRLSN